jgi:hypothetical protein
MRFKSSVVFLSFFIGNFSAWSEEKSPPSIPPMNYQTSASPVASGTPSGANPLLSNTHYRNKKPGTAKAPVQLHGAAVDGQGGGGLKGKVGSF